MKLLTDYKFQLETEKSPESIQLLLEQHTSLETPSIFNKQETFDFWGKIELNRFKVSPCLTYRNTFVPVIEGEVRRNGNRVIIEINMTMSIFAKCFLGICLILSGVLLLPIFFFTIAGSFSFWKALIFCIPTCVAIVLSSWAFLYEARKAEKLLRSICNVTIHSGFKIRDANSPEIFD